MCPKCGSNDGYYEKRICKYWQFFNFDDVTIDSSEMYGVKGGKRKFCAACNKDITSYIKEKNNCQI